MQFVSASNFAVVLGMTLGIVVAIVLFWGRLNVKEALGAGTASGLSALMVTSMIMGFGGVVQASPTFQTCVNWLLGLDMSCLLYTSRSGDARQPVRHGGAGRV